MYGDAFLDRAADAHGDYDADLMATLAEFVARTIAVASPVRRLGPPVEELIVAGGGAKNATPDGADRGRSLSR